MNKEDFEQSKLEFAEERKFREGAQEFNSSDSENLISDGMKRFSDEDVEKAIEYIRTRRINLNVRQLKKLNEPTPSNCEEIDPRLSSIDGQIVNEF